MTGEVRTRRGRASIRPGAVLVRLFAAIGLCSLLPLAHASQQPSALERELASEPSTAAAVELDGRELFRVRGTALIPAAKRAAVINERLLAVASDPAIAADSLRIVEEPDLTRIVAGDTTIIAFADLDAEGLPRRRIAELGLKEMVKRIEEYRVARTPRVLLEHTAHALGLTLVAAALLYGLFRLRRWLVNRARKRFAGGGTELRIQAVKLIQARQLWLATRMLLNAATTLAVLVVAYLHLSTVLGLYPWTRKLADQLFMLFLQPLQVMGAAVLASVPDLTFVLVLVLVTRYLLKALALMFQGVETGAVSFEGFDPEWARPTYKIVRILVIAFAVVVAYPYIPGSESQAFKGVTLFLGVIFSLGSSSVISNVIAGYTMTYRRAFRIGDRVQIGDITGFVTDTSLLVTRLRSMKNEEVVVPNSEILNNAVTNYSALARAEGVILHTTVGIGYETPWRQVEAMLMIAADRTPGLEKEPKPYVLQKALGDFCVVYELNGYCRDAHMLGLVYTDMHRNILDVFNEYGVQIMTPAYEGDPQAPKLVPREQWFLAPAPAEPGK